MHKLLALKITKDSLARIYPATSGYAPHFVSNEFDDAFSSRPKTSSTETIAIN